MAGSRRRPEADHERGVVCPFYGGAGFVVSATSARVHPIGVTPGIPDLIVQAVRWPLTWWHETKVDKLQTETQFAFMMNALASGTPYVLGDITSAMEFVCFLGLAERLNETVRWRPRANWGNIMRAKFVEFHGDGVERPVDSWRVTNEWRHSDAFKRQVLRWGYLEGARTAGLVPPTAKRTIAC